MLSCSFLPTVFFNFLSATRLSKKLLNELTENLNEAVYNCFSEKELNLLAYDTEFVQRATAKLNGYMFFCLTVFHNEKLKMQALESLCETLRDEFGLKIEKQSLNERFNEKATDFLKTALEKLLQNQLFEQAILLKNTNFNRILIKDSVCFELPEELAEVYEGSGGSASAAMIRIQFEYDLLSGKISDLSLNAFNDQDQTNAIATIELTKENDLIIRDLGYINLSALKKIIKRNASFLNRLGYNIKVYIRKDDKYEEVDFVKIRQFMIKNKLSVHEKEVYIGQKEKLQVRLVIYLLPDEVVEQRLRKARKSNKTKNLSKEYKARAALNLFITNTTSEQIPAKLVWTLYRLRWQIELVFKIWKSIFGIDKVKKVKLERFECYLYGKLILIVLGWQILWRIAKVLFNRKNRLLSFYKAFNALLNKWLDDIKSAVLNSTNDFGTFIYKLYKRSEIYYLLERKGKEQSPMEELLTMGK